MLLLRLKEDHPSKLDQIDELIISTSPSLVLCGTVDGSKVRVSTKLLLLTSTKIRGMLHNLYQHDEAITCILWPGGSELGVKCLQDLITIKLYQADPASMTKLKKQLDYLQLNTEIISLKSETGSTEDDEDEDDDEDDNDLGGEEDLSVDKSSSSKDGETGGQVSTNGSTTVDNTSNKGSNNHSITFLPSSSSCGDSNGRNDNSQAIVGSVLAESFVASGEDGRGNCNDDKDNRGDKRVVLTENGLEKASEAEAHGSNRWLENQNDLESDDTRLSVNPSNLPELPPLQPLFASRPLNIKQEFVVEEKLTESQNLSSSLPSPSRGGNRDSIRKNGQNTTTVEEVPASPNSMINQEIAVPQTRAKTNDKSKAVFHEAESTTNRRLSKRMRRMSRHEPHVGS